MNYSQLVTPSEAEMLLSPSVRAALYATQIDAWGACCDWPQRYPEFSLGDGCFAHVMNEAVTTYARRNLVDLQSAGDVELDDERGFLLVVIKNPPRIAKNKALGLKFNKFDEEFQPRQNRSFQNQSIFAQELLFSEPEPQRASAQIMTVATVGWCPDPQMLRDPDFAVACNANGRLLWQIPLLAPPASGSLAVPVVNLPQGGPKVRSSMDKTRKGRKAE